MSKIITKNSPEITDFPELLTYPGPNTALPTLKVNGIAKITTQVLSDGLAVNINNKVIRLHYPPSIWNRFPKTHRKILSQNITYALTFQLPFLYTSLKRMLYNMPVPLAESFFFKALSLALPSTAIMQTQKDKRITSDLLRRLFEIDYLFSHHKTAIPPYNRISMSDRAIMPFTFGKDSLLTFALAREFGIKVYPVYISEPYLPYEELVKKSLAVPFKREFHTQIGFLKNSLGVFREPEGWLGWELQLTQYSLMLLPYVYSNRAGFIFFSNEQSCDVMATDDDGFRYNPVFEQSHSWLLQNSLMTSIIGGNSLSIGSLLEPIHDLGIIKILHTRYPDIAKYQTSCDMPQRPKSDGRWCENCTKCGRMYIFFLANGIDPKKIGFKHDLLKGKYQHLYSIFTSDKVRDSGYDQSNAGRDEQILAFYLAYKKGYKGPVMQTFRRRYLSYAKKYEKSLRQTFYGIHSTKTVPVALRSKLLRIYRSELDPMR
jgi:hypothetical protein